LFKYIDQAYARLSDDEKWVFTLRYYANKKTTEISQITGFSDRKTFYKLKAAVAKMGQSLMAQGFTKEILNEIQ
jgi:DNA-directed RNA polymerase specialized sigma24 family protein